MNSPKQQLHDLSLYFEGMADALKNEKEKAENLSIQMKYSIRQNHLNKTMLFENGIQVRQPTASELEFWARIQELEKYIGELENVDEIQSTAIAKYQEKLDELEREVAHWKSNHDNQVKLKSQLMDRPDLQDRAASIQKLQERIAELEAWNEMLTETGHWIGQDEAYDLKVEVEEFLDSMRWENAWVASSESINRLREVLNKCEGFKAYSDTNDQKTPHPN